MLFSDFKSKPFKEISTSLLWEYDLKNFDYQGMKLLVVQRVIERGRMEDFYAMLNLYGLEEVKNTLRNIKMLNKKDMNFVSVAFDIPFKELRCYREQQLTRSY
jgi:hypothetical protein